MKKLFLILVPLFMLGALFAAPLNEGFESETCPPADWTIRYANPSPPAGNLMIHTTDYYHQGTRSFRFSSYSYGAPYDEYLITPQLSVTAGDQTVSFYYRKYTYGSETFRVGWSSTGNATTDFTWSSDITNASTTWQQYVKNDLPVGTKYVAIHYKSNYAYYLYIDTFVGPQVYSAPPNPAVCNYPPNGNLGIPNNAILSWSSGGGSPTAYDVYFGTSADNLERVSILQPGTTYNPGTLQYGQTYFWKIDPWNEAYQYASQYNDLPVWSFTTMADPTIYTFPYTAGNFENGGSLPLNWIASEGATGASYHWAASTGAASHGPSAPHSGTYFGWLYCYLASNSYNPYYLTTPPIALDATAKRLSYWYWIGTDTYTNPLFVEISTDNQETWTTLYTHSNTSNTLDWFQNTISLESYASTTVYLRFKGMSNYGSYMTDLGLDDIVIEDIPAAPILSYNPTSLNFGALLQNTTSSPQNVTITNTGAGILNLAVADVNISGDNPDMFNVNTTNLPANLAAGQSVIIPVTATVTQEGPVSAILEISYNEAIYEIPLSAEGLPLGSVIIGTGTLTQRQPFGILWGFERSAAIYTNAQIGSYGVLDKVSWNCATTSTTGVPYKIYAMQTTDTEAP